MKHKDNIPVLIQKDVYVESAKIEEILPDGTAKVQSRDSGERGIVDSENTDYLLSRLSEQERSKIPGYRRPIKAKSEDKLLRWLAT